MAFDPTLRRAVLAVGWMEALPPCRAGSTVLAPRATGARGNSDARIPQGMAGAGGRPGGGRRARLPVPELLRAPHDAAVAAHEDARGRPYHPGRPRAHPVLVPAGWPG